MKPFPAHLRPVLEAPLHVAGGVNALGRSLGLFLALVLHANDRGHIIRTRQRFAEDLGVSEADIDQWLVRLVDAKLIDLQSPSPFLVISLRSWPRSGVVTEDFKNTADVSSTAADSGLAEKEQKNKSSLSSRDGGLGEGNALLTELGAVLGEADAADVAPHLSAYPEATVRRILDRVRATPGRQIRKSRTALFRYLLKNAANTTP